MAIILERRLTKDQILELYLNEVYLGQRGSFAIHGVPEAARLFFGKDVRNLTLAEAATHRRRDPVAVTLSPFRNPRARTRPAQRGAAGDGRDRVSPTQTTRRASQRNRSSLAARARIEAPYFVDYVEQDARARPREPPDRQARPSSATRRSTCTSSAWRRKPSATGMAHVDKQLASPRKRRARRRRRSSPSIRAPATSSRSSAAAPTTSRSTTGRRARGGSRARSSSRSSISPPSKHGADRGPAPICTPATVVHGRADDLQGRREGLRAGELRRRVRRADHAAARAGAGRATSRRSRSPR